MKLQETLIRYVLNPVGKWMDRVPSGLKDFGFYLGGIGLFALFFLNAMGIRFSRYIIVFMVGSVFLGVMLLCILPKQMKMQRITPLVVIPWLGTAGFMMLSGILRNTDQLAGGLMLLVVYPATWYIFMQAGIEGVFRRLCRLCIGSFVVFMILGLFFVPFDPVHYRGFFLNPNMLGIYLTLVISCALTEAFNAKGTKQAFAAALITYGVAGALLFYNNSRSSQVAFILVLLCALVLNAVKHRKKLGAFFLRRVAPIILTLILAIPLTLGLFKMTGGIRESVLSNGMGLHAIVERIFRSDETQMPEEPIDEPLPEEGDAWLQDVVENNKDRYTTQGKTLDRILSGRVSVWTEFSKHITLLGEDGEISYFVEPRNQTYNTAHNTFLQYAVQYGAIAACFFAIFVVLSGVRSVRYAMKSRDGNYVWMPLLVAIAFGAIALMETLQPSYDNMLATYYFVVQAPLMFQAASEQKQKTDLAA